MTESEQQAMARHRGRDRFLLAWDLGIVFLVSINLGLIIFDTLFAIPFVSQMIEWLSPALHAFYDNNIHSNFVTIDLAFVALFAADVLAGWAVAVYQQRYHRWFFYPFVHWYDVLGCIPLAGFRFLRVLRLISLGFRLQKLGVIDVRGWYVTGVLAKYYNILMEEISDRVVVNVLNGVQDEVESGGGELPRRVVGEVIAPRKERLVEAVSGRLGDTVTQAYASNREEVRRYVGSMVARAVHDNLAVQGLERVPMLGSYVIEAVDAAITDAICNVLDEAVEGLSSVEFDNLVQKLTDSVFERLLDEKAVADPDITQAVMEIIDLLKEQVQVQQWKERYA